jgi:ABC-type nitrate/sulfonate/bicarbonate transport system permease component
MMSEQRQTITNRVAFLEQKIPSYAAVLGIAGLLLLWEIVCRLEIVPPLFLPAPTAILAAAWEMISSGELYKDLIASMYRIGAGYALGAVLGIVVGLLLVDPMLIKAAVTFGSNHLNVIRKVILPGSLPMIFAGLKLAAGTSLLLLVSAEMIAAQEGIGSMVLHYGNLMITTKLMVGVLLLSLLGLTFNRVLQWLERKLIPWK